MLLQVTHQTRYDYQPPVETAKHLAHLKPRNTATQQLVSHRLTVSPAPVQASESLDLYGNTRAFFSLVSSHEQLIVEAESVVRTRAMPTEAPVAGDMPWERVRDAFRYQKGTQWDAASEFVFPSHHVPRSDAFAAYARSSFEAGRGLLDAACDLTRRIHSEFDYDPKSTEVSTPAAEALAKRRGVCQDFAHIMIACLRSLGLPARYVSGYLLTRPPPGQPRLVGADASHAWLSVYLPGQGEPGKWIDFDPTNNRRSGEDYVTLAIGRDYADVSPMRGVLHGGARHKLKVEVTVQPLEDDLASPSGASNSS